jgi:translation initiation factor eIF-2B subunit delta
MSTAPTASMVATTIIEGGGGNKKQQKEPKNKDQKKPPREDKGGSSGGRSGGGERVKQDNATTPRKASAAVSSSIPPRLGLFDHLHKSRDQNSHTQTIQTDFEVHPAIEKFGLFSKHDLLHSDDDRAEAFLMAVSEVIETYTTPQSVALKNDLLRLIKHQVNYLVQHSRLHSMGMGNIIKYIYFVISKVPIELSEADAKSHILNEFQTFQDEKISLARQSICSHFQEIIKDGEVIVTYGSSPLIRSMFLSLMKLKKSLRIIIIDSMPQWEGLRTLQSLQHFQSTHGEHDEINGGFQSPHISFVYAPLSGAANAIKDSSRVILGASGLLSNGSVFAQAGTGMIACLAHFYRIPVIFAAESYKFTDKVQMDSIIFNELSDPSQLMKLSVPPAPLSSAGSHSNQQQSSQNQPKHAIYLPRDRHEKDRSRNDQPHGEDFDNLLPPRLQLLNLNYDLTPIQNVSAILTEVGLIPPTSIPVLLRELKYDVNS